jgi:hypothetical protein
MLVTFYHIIRRIIEGSSLVIAAKLQIQVKFESLYPFRLLMTDTLVRDVAFLSRRSHEIVQVHKRTKNSFVISLIQQRLINYIR